MGHEEGFGCGFGEEVMVDRNGGDTMIGEARSRWFSMYHLFR